MLMPVCRVACSSVTARALARRAGELADECALRGYGAVHLATALALSSGETIFATWDRDLSNVAVGAGLAVAPAL
jgi:uncharacterized protein